MAQRGMRIASFLSVPRKQREDAMEQTIKKELENAASKGAGTFRRFARTVTGKAGDLAERVSTSADSAIDTLGERIGDVGESISDRTSGMGWMERAGHAVAGGLQDAGRYMKRQNLRGMVMDVGGVMRRNPGKTILVGLGVGYLIARWMRD
jgi:hypothetical protein